MVVPGPYMEGASSVDGKSWGLGLISEQAIAKHIKITGRKSCEK